MTHEEFLKSFAEDPLFLEKGLLDHEKLKNIKFSQQSGIKLLEVIKIAIDGNIKAESGNAITRQINQYLNKK